MTNAEIKVLIDSLTATENDEKEVIYQQLGDAKMVINELLDTIHHARETIERLESRKHQLELTVQDLNSELHIAKSTNDEITRKIVEFKNAFNNLINE